MQTNEVFESVKKTILDTIPEFPPESVVQNVSLTELGIDSIKIVELGVRLEEIFGEEVILDDWLDMEMDKSTDSAYNINSLVEFIEGKL